MTEDNQHYRYCFQCDKWKKKEEINEIDWGNGNKSYNCDTCRKDLGDTIQIFRCQEHEEEILKVWGTLEGVNQEKVFYQACPQKQQQEPSWWEKIPLPAKIGGGILTFLLGLLATFKLWFNKKVEKAEDQLEKVKDKMSKKKKSDENVEEKADTIPIPPPPPTPPTPPEPKPEEKQQPPKKPNWDEIHEAIKKRRKDLGEEEE